LGKLSRKVPARRVVPHKDPAHLRLLCDVILDDFHLLTGSTVAAAAH